jgi:hypothetical protein
MDTQGDKALADDVDPGAATAVGVDSRTVQDLNQGSSNKGESVAKEIDKGLKGDEHVVEVLAVKPVDSVFCHRCKIVGHYTKECRRVLMGDRDEF